MKFFTITFLSTIILFAFSHSTNEDPSGTSLDLPTETSADLPNETTFLIPPFFKGPRGNTTGIQTHANIGASMFLDGTYKCETTTGSPHESNIRKSAEKLEALTTQKCVQKNPHGSHCTKMSVTGDAVIGICGKNGGWVACPDAGWAARFLVEKCQWKLFVGGWYQFTHSNDVWIIVYRSF